MANVVRIGDSIEEDITAITSIYAEQVIAGLASFEIEAPTRLEMSTRRASLLEQGYPYLVASVDEQVVGYAYAGPYRAREAYKYTLENSLYVSADARRRGIGTALLSALLKRCSAGSWHSVIAVIGDSENHASIRLHASLGFEMIGTLKRVGFKHNQWVDSVLMQKLL